MQSDIRRDPLYSQVALAIEKKLQNNTWDIDQPLPAEPDMAQLFGVSVGTIRKAVDNLVDRGVLTRRQGSGTFVKRYSETGYWNRFQRFQSLDRKLIHWQGKLVAFERCPANKEVATALHIKPGDEILHVIREMRFAGQNADLTQPFGWDQSWLRLPEFKNLTAAAYEQNGDLSLYEIYEKVACIVIVAASDFLSVQETIPDPLHPQAAALTGPFYKMQRQARTFCGITVEYRVATPRCDGLGIVFTD